MVTKQLRILCPILVTLCCFCYVACSSGVSQNETAGDQPTTTVNLPSSPQDGKGAARVIPNDPVVINTYGTWEIVYSVGREGIAPGGGIAVHISPYWGWTQPQNRNPDYPGYTTVSTSNQKVTLDIAIGSPHYIVVRTKDTPLTLNDTITITYGDTSGGKHLQVEPVVTGMLKRVKSFLLKWTVMVTAISIPLRINPGLLFYTLMQMLL